MKVSLNWLKRYVDIEEDPATLSHDLTMFGLNVESVEITGGEYTGVVFGRVLECGRHPNADNLSVCSVDTGSGTPLNIVCGASNVRAGLSVAVAVQGAVLKGGFKIKKTKLRGELSEGMICSETELGIGEDASGIIELDMDLEPGTNLDGRLGSSDVILDIEVTPNRPDQLSHFGIAREIAALYMRDLREPEFFELEPGYKFQIETRDDGDCPRYSAAFVDEIKIEPSPRWMQDLLISAGVKPIHNIVDVTNFVLLEMGQPLHAFDRDMLGRDGILVRRGKQGESMYTLDDIEREIGGDVLLITDGDTPVGVAGVMGGRDSEITDKTKRVLIESAWFDPRAVRRSSRELKLDTEASYRFERECDPGITVKALERACMLIAEIGAGRPEKMHADYLAESKLIEPRTITLRTKQANRLMGTRLAADDLVELLSRLELKAVEDGKDVSVTVPTFRRDIVVEVDLIEEIARLYGYENIGRDEERRSSMFSEVSVEDMRNDELRDRLAARGFAEVITTSFMDPGDPGRFEWGENDPRSRPVEISNPLTASQSAMRSSLLPGMLWVIQRNSPVELDGIRIFELAKVFLKRKEGRGLPLEELHLTAMFTRKSAPLQWHGEQRDFDFFDMTGEAESVLEWLGAPEDLVMERRKADEPDFFFEWLLKNNPAGTCGLIPGRVAARFDIDTPVYYFDLLLDALPPGGGGRKAFSRVSQYPGVKRDLSVLAPERVTFSDVRNVVKKRAKHLESVRLFDYYRGDRLGEGKKSYAFRMTFRSLEGTLDDKTVDRTIEKVLASLQNELQVALRAE
ncbi:MAG: phenylalanine--tRNA ligase subunit beta [Candidatus Krumholzibacteria bacterium]|nr:phenylalanine--tRNA ligase subunit beta [Candidatus Krumholzibacteria bacterium]